jgi:two-component system, LytTR family, response regulator
VERILGGIEPRTNVIALAPELARALKKHEPAYLSRLASRIGDRVEFIDASQVTHFYIYIYTKDKLTYAATANKDYVVDHTIADLESKLDPARFIRIHRATILNVD